MEKISSYDIVKLAIKITPVLAGIGGLGLGIGGTLGAQALINEIKTDNAAEDLVNASLEMQGISDLIPPAQKEEAAELFEQEMDKDPVLKAQAFQALKAIRG